MRNGVAALHDRHFLSKSFKYSSLSTGIGAVTKTIDRGMVLNMFRKNSPSVIGDKGVDLGLEFKF